MAHMQLHALKIMVGMMAEKYTVKFKTWAGRTGFKDTALEDAYIQGLPHSILPKVYSQTSLLSGLGLHNVMPKLAVEGTYTFPL